MSTASSSYGGRLRVVVRSPLAAALMLFGGSQLTHASSAWEGVPAISWVASVSRTDIRGDTLSVTLILSGEMPIGAKVRWDIHGDQNVVVVSPSSHWEGRAGGPMVVDALRCVVRRPGALLTGEATVETRKGRLEISEFELAMPSPAVAAARFSVSRAVREERLDGTQRYRYADWVIVPIDGPERLTQPELNARGRRARRTEGSLDLRTSLANADSIRVVPIIIVVSKAGQPLRVKVGPAEGVGESLRGEIEAFARSWKFKPAEIDGRTVADWVKEDVRIIRN